MYIIDPTSIHIVIQNILTKSEKQLGILKQDIAHLPHT